MCFSVSPVSLKENTSMNGKWSSAILSFVLLWNCGSIMQNSSSDQMKARNLNLYERAGPYTLGLNIDTPSRANMEAEVRDFLWQHWHQHRLGYVVVISYTKEGEPNTASYFIEPDSRGIWRVAIEVKRLLIDRGVTKRRRYETGDYTVHSVQRIEVPKDGMRLNVSIPEGETRTPHSYRLALKDEKGKPLFQL